MPQASPSKTALERPVLAVDVALLTLKESTPMVLLQKRPRAPYAAQLALPGVAVQTDETLLNAASRALKTRTPLSETAIKATHLEQLAAFDAIDRDPRGRSIAVAFLGIIQPALTSEEEEWHPVQDRVFTLPFDHENIVKVALERLRGKLRYTAISAALMPSLFPVESLRQVYEAILGQPLNRSNFRTRLTRIGLIERAEGITPPKGQKGGRPAHLYRFARRLEDEPMRDFF